jgi:uncharacterized protein (DUF2141 family)
MVVARSAVLLSLALVLAGPAAARAATLTVEITGVRSTGGAVYVALFSKPDGFPDGDYSDRYAIVPARTEPITVLFENLAPGRYAVGAYHDENGNHRLDTNWIGYPTEGYALSNGVRAVFSRPRFAAASFPVAEAGTRVRLRIVY